MKHIELSNRNNNILRGYLHFNEKTMKDLVVMFHGFTGNKTEHAGHFRNLARKLEQENIGSLRLDFYGNGESDGEFRDFTFDTLMEDAEDIVSYALTIVGSGRIHLLGFSMGGAVAAMVARKVKEHIASLMLWSPAGNILEKIRMYYEAGKKMDNDSVLLGSFELSSAMVHSLSSYQPYDGLDSIHNPVCIIHGANDLAVPIAYGERYASIFPNALWIRIEDTNHGYDEYESRIRLYNETIAFLKKQTQGEQYR